MTRSRHKRHTSAPAVIVRRSRADEAASRDTERAQVLTSLRATLREMAGLDASDSAETASALQEAQTALSTLARLTPDILERMPDLGGQLHAVARLADERLRASGYSGGAYTASAPRLDLVREAPTGSSPVASGNAAGWAGMGVSAVRHDAMGVPNADYLRRLATKNPWVQAAITTRKQQIGRADITVMPDDPLAPFDASIQDAAEDLLNYPNEMKDSYRSLVEPVIDDILTLDRGAISKDLDPRGVPHHLYAEDGSTIRIFADWKGEPDKPRYLFVPPGSAPGVVGNQQGIPLYNDQLICIMANAASYRFGLAPTQVLLDTIRGDLAATEKAMALVRDVPPPHLVNIRTSQGSGVAQKTIDTVRTEYERKIAGQREIMFLGADDLQVFPLMFSLKDNQFLEWQVYLARKICACYQISPQQIGITFDINKATSETQQELFEDSGLLPLMLLLEEYLNRELLADFAPKRKRDGRPDMRRLNLRVFYPEISELARMRHAERVIKTVSDSLGGLPLLTPNQAMEMLGREPVPGGNRFWVFTQTNGVIPTPLGYDNDFGDWGSMPTAGDLGAQDPEGGIDEEAHEPQDIEGERPGSKGDTAATTPAIGNESSGTGDAPNLQDADNNPISAGGAAASAAVTPSTRKAHTVARGVSRESVRQRSPQVSAWLLRACDARQPGAAWSAATDSLTRQRSAAIAAHGGYPQRYTSGFTLGDAEGAGEAEGDTDSMPPALLGAGWSGATHTASHTATHTASHTASQADRERGHTGRAPKPIGRILPDAAAAHTLPRKRLEAQSVLAAAVKRVFEDARLRGQRGSRDERAQGA